MIQVDQVDQEGLTCKVREHFNFEDRRYQLGWELS